MSKFVTATRHLLTVDVDNLFNIYISPERVREVRSDDEFQNPYFGIRNSFVLSFFCITRQINFVWVRRDCLLLCQQISFTQVIQLLSLGRYFYRDLVFSDWRIVLARVFHRQVWIRHFAANLDTLFC